MKSPHQPEPHRHRPATRAKIAVVVPKFGLIGGGEHFASEITRRLAQNPNYEFHILANRWAPVAGFTFHKIPYLLFPRFLRPLFFAWMVERRLKQLKPDLVHTHHWIYRADVFSLHGLPHHRWVDRVLRRSMNWYDRAFDSIRHYALSHNPRSWFLPVSSITQEEYEHSTPMLPGHWQVMSPGVDLERFAAPSREDSRSSLIQHHPSLAGSDLILLFVGMNFELKGLDPIIASLGLAKAQAPEQKIRLVVVGRGNQAKYQRLAEEHGVGTDVVFTGAVSSHIEEIYRASDALLLLSAFDTFGMVVSEAMAAGLPVLVSNHVGAKDLVREGENGYVLESPPQPRRVAGHILALLDAAHRARMADSALNTARHHGWDSVAQQMDQIYRAILSEKSTSRSV
jgi:UDP-glucose:(heptosyl)LPS alpha-1,3-glucosyltransferase